MDLLLPPPPLSTGSRMFPQSLATSFDSSSARAPLHPQAEHHRLPDLEAMGPRLLAERQISGAHTPTAAGCSAWNRAGRQEQAGSWTVALTGTG